LPLDFNVLSTPATQPRRCGCGNPRSGRLAAADHPPDEFAYIWIQFELVMNLKTAKALGVPMRAYTRRSGMPRARDFASLRPRAAQARVIGGEHDRFRCRDGTEGRAVAGDPAVRMPRGFPLFQRRHRQPDSN
jgi:hypothetical protein